MKKIKEQFSKWLQINIDNDPEFANCRDASLNNIEEVLFISYGLKTIYLTIVILNISYVLGMIWIIVCEFIEDFYLDTDFKDANEGLGEDYFIRYFSLENMTAPQTTIIATYFMFTSLSTVGFGDYHPRSDFERVYGALVLLFGVAIFSYIMGNFIQILDEFKSYNKELDQGDELNKFFGVLKHFNGDKEYELSHKKQIE